MNPKKVMIVSPHPDDLEIGMGGTAAKMIEKGAEVISFVVTDGRRSTSKMGLDEDQMAELRKKEVREAAGILGLDVLALLELPDAEDENTAIIKQEFEGIIEKKSPDALFLPHPEIDKHPTHKAVSESILEKISEMKSAGKDVPNSIWFYEVWTPFPNYDRIEDITEYVEVKTALIECHKSQLEYKNYTEGVLGLNRYRAVFDERHGVTDELYAEVFLEYKQ